MLSAVFDICCGKGEEYEKGRAVSHPTVFEEDEEELNRADSLHRTRAHIQCIEHQVSLLNKSRNPSRNTIVSRPLCNKKTCNYAPPTFEKSEEDTAFLIGHLEDNFIFQDLTSGERLQLAEAMQCEEALQGTTIFEKGDEGTFFYICQSGKLEYFDNGKKVSGISEGQSFGELALLYDARRVATCVAASTSKLWKVDQSTFRYILAHNTYKQSSSLKDLIRKIEMFKDLDEAIVNRFVHSLTSVHWKAGERIVEKGEVGNVFYIVTKGQVRVHDIGLGDSQYEDQVLNTGEAFGERALLIGERRAANVTAISDTTTMAIDRATFEEYVGPMQSLMERDMRKKFLKSLPLIHNSQLTAPEIDNLVDFMTELCYRKGEFLAQPGHPYQMNLWVIRHGTMLVYSSKHPEKIFSLQSGDYFGDKSIRGEPGHISSHTAVCEQNLTTWVLTREDIEHVIGDISRLGNSVDFARSKQDRSIVLSHLKKHRVLGQGAFGRVWLVSHKNTGAAYALKMISKRKLIESEQVQSVLRENDMLCLLQHPFILHLVSSFQDDNMLYLLLPVIQGGELYSQLQKENVQGKGLPAKAAAFYAACIVEALGHFHQRLIAYRDLKLENVLLDSDGYCVIVDLGFAKVVADKTFTLVGTPEYLAPEVIMSKGHSSAADYWSYGVLTYELLCGKSPFYKKGSTQMDMFKRIVMVNYEMPDFVGSHEKLFIEQLLVRNTANRLGNLANGHVDVKRHDWFAEQNINFKNIRNKETEGPWKPTVTNPLELSETFDDFSFLEDNATYRGTPLSTEHQELFSSF